MVKKPSVDGFIPRRSPGTIGEYHQGYTPVLPAPISEASGLKRAETKSAPVLSASGQALSRADVDESLRQIDESSAVEIAEKRHKRFRRRAAKRPVSSRRKIVKWLVIAVITSMVVFAGWFGVKVLLAGHAVFKGDFFGILQQKDLKQDANGRSNVLIVGTSEDDPGHQGATLTDSIMILSIDQKNKNAYMISIPRDLEARYGRSCIGTGNNAGKVNAFFACSNDDFSSDSAETERQNEARKFFGDIVGLDIQYSVHVNYSVMRDLVGALGGITVTIESRDPRGQMDANFDWKCRGGNAYASLATMKKNCPPNGHFIDYPNGPVTLDAEHALYLAQARGDVENYGFEMSNFDREKNQQKIIVAIKEKAMSSGTLTDIGKVMGIIDAIGKNLRTNFDTSEIRTLTSLAKDIPSSSVQSISLIDNQLVDPSGQPRAGLYNFSKIQAFLKKKLSTDPLLAEGAQVTVLNGSGVTGAAQKQVDTLADIGIDATAGNAPSGDYSANVIYQLNDKKPATAKKLTELYGVTPVTTAPPVTVNEGVDFIIILAPPAKSASP